MSMEWINHEYGLLKLSDLENWLQRERKTLFEEKKQLLLSRVHNMNEFNDSDFDLFNRVGMSEKYGGMFSETSDSKQEHIIIELTVRYLLDQIVLDCGLPGCEWGDGLFVKVFDAGWDTDFSELIEYGAEYLLFDPSYLFDEIRKNGVSETSDSEGYKNLRAALDIESIPIVSWTTRV